VSRAEKNSLEFQARRVLVLQAVLGIFLVLLILVTGYVVGNEGRMVENALAGMCGALLGMAGTVLSRRSASRSSRAAVDAPQYAMVPIYLGLLNKLLVVGGGLAIGMVALGFGPIYIVSGYAITQIAQVWVALRRA
jgi:hypothetical protein